MSSRPEVSFTCFVPLAVAESSASGNAQRTDYEVDAVARVQGPPAGGVERGQAWSRLEQLGALAAPDAPFIGSTQHVVYTDAAARSDLSQISRSSSGPVAVLIPICKSASWWGLAQEQRQAYFLGGPRLGHTGLGRAFAGRIYRRLYHSRYLPGSSWDFLTYFEFPESERASFRQLLSILRDPEQNPEWAFVEREIEIWMRKRDG